MSDKPLTKKQIIKELKTPGTWIQQDKFNSPLYLACKEGWLDVGNQKMLKEVIQELHMTENRWLQGWDNPIETGKKKWTVN
jgi:hypothetical protein